MYIDQHDGIFPNSIMELKPNLFQFKPKLREINERHKTAIKIIKPTKVELIEETLILFWIYDSNKNWEPILVRRVMKNITK